MGALLFFNPNKLRLVHGCVTRCANPALHFPAFKVQGGERFEIRDRRATLKSRLRAVVSNQTN